MQATWQQSVVSIQVAESGRTCMLFEQLILYPLNALVEDQLRRLRSTLDSDSDPSWNIHHWLDTPTSRRKPYFIWSVYWRQTPVPGCTQGSTNAMNRLRARICKKWQIQVRSIRQQLVERSRTLDSGYSILTFQTLMVVRCGLDGICRILLLIFSSPTTAC